MRRPGKWKIILVIVAAVAICLLYVWSAYYAETNTFQPSPVLLPRKSAA
jgi:hypothetical protein